MKNLGVALVISSQVNRITLELLKFSLKLTHSFQQTNYPIFTHDCGICIIYYYHVVLSNNSSNYIHYIVSGGLDLKWNKFDLNLQCFSFLERERDFRRN